mmetsp:Transcript_26112/g.39514  ORF Transcript_26112/g.39514 Transcript_26112/m.39514 type:complete len:376 (-) Transcript_26112:188-1315(-)
MDPTYELNRDLASNVEENESLNTARIVVSVFSKIFFFLLIFGMAGTTDIEKLQGQFKNVKAVVIGVVMQFVIMPLLGFITVISLKDHGLSGAVGITLLVVTSSPGGSFSNWVCSVFNADLALSVAMTAFSTLLSIGLLPANLLLYSFLAYNFDERQKDILKSLDWGALFLSLGLVIAGIITGMYGSYKTSNSDKFHRIANRIGTISGIIFVTLASVLSTGMNGGNEERPKLWEQNWSFYVAVLTPCSVGLLLSSTIAFHLKLKKPETVTIAVECCFQNVTIAMSMVTSMFNDPADIVSAMAVPLFYGLFEHVAVILFCLVAWKLGWTKAPKDDNFCVVLGKTYEIEADDDGGDEETAGLDAEHRADGEKAGKEAA